MAYSQSFGEILCGVPENKRYLLDAKVENDRHLVEIARKIPDWQEVLPYLIETEVEVTEAAILEEHRKPERRRMAVLQKWKEKHSSRATYTNLAKSFYEAGKLSLVEAVCKIVTMAHPKDIKPGAANLAKSFYEAGKLSLVEAVCETVAMAHPEDIKTSAVPVFPSRTCRYCRFFILAVIIVGLVLALYLHQNDNSLNGHGNHIQSQQTPTHANQGGTHSPPNGEVTHFGGKAGEISPNNLPYLIGPFIGRVEAVQDITHNLLYSKNMVHIFGLPAVGKSTLAVHVGYEVATHRFAVRYINVDEAHIFKLHHETESIKAEDHFQTPSDALSERIGDIALPLYSHTEKRYISTSTQGLIEWAKGLSNDTLLILDNCDSLLVNKREEFIELLGTLNKASQFLLIVTTSRLKVTLLDGFKKYKLKPLSNQSAIELLQSFTINLNDSRTINDLVAGIPLALKIIGSLVSDTQPSSLIITNLKQNLIGTLTPGDIRPQREKMRPVLQLSYNYLDTSNQECALYLSHFPGSFSHEAGLQILSKSNFSSPNECLKHLSDRSLLDSYYYSGQLRYQFHKLIKQFLMDLASQNSSLIFAIAFDSSFLTYYSQVFRKFVSRYNEVSHDEENIGRFEYESHNLRYLLKKFHYRHTYPIMALVDLIYTLNSDLVQKVLTISEILSAERKALMLFEDQMDDISVHFGASETLDIYRELILGLRKWFPCSEYYVGWCELTFPLRSFASRFRIIDKLLAKTNHNPHEYYMELMFPYYNPFNISVCFSEFSGRITNWWIIVFGATFVVIVVIRCSPPVVLSGRFIISVVPSVRVRGVWSIPCESLKMCGFLMMFTYMIIIACGLIFQMSVISLVYLCPFCLALIVTHIVMKVIEHTFLLKAPFYLLLLVLVFVKYEITTFYIARILVIILTGILSNKKYFPTFVSLFVVSARAFSVTNIGLYIYSFVFTFWYYAQKYVNLIIFLPSIIFYIWNNCYM